MTTKFWMHTAESEPDYCPHCGKEYNEGSPHHGEAGKREVVVSDELDDRKTVQMYRCNNLS